VEEHLPSKCKAPSSNPNTSKKLKKKKEVTGSLYSPSYEVKSMCTDQQVSIGINFQKISI
jgi:hypothetical protein